MINKFPEYLFLEEKPKEILDKKALGVEKALQEFYSKGDITF